MLGIICEYYIGKNTDIVIFFYMYYVPYCNGHDPE